ncbi:hypothetical protein dqs_0582 [Azoarcus olearius]|nr:hypothetical protein dqs_0582 [Azoarcus olearius]
MGVSPDMVQRYIREESAPGLEKLERLAGASGYRYRWLAYAEDPAQEAPPATAAWLDGATLGQRLRMVRAGVLCMDLPQFASLAGLTSGDVERMERDLEVPPASHLDLVVELSGVRKEWLECRVPPMFEVTDPLVRGVVDARLRRDSVRSTGTGESTRYLSALDRAVEGMPRSAALAGGAISVDLLVQVVTAIEQWQEANRSKVRISPAKKAALIAIAYAHFEGKKFEERDMAHIFRLVA